VLMRKCHGNTGKLRWGKAGVAANGICERLLGTIRRECVGWLIPPSEAHLRRALRFLGRALQPWTLTYGVGSRRPRSRTCRAEIKAEGPPFSR